VESIHDLLRGGELILRQESLKRLVWITLCSDIALCPSGGCGILSAKYNRMIVARDDHEDSSYARFCAFFVFILHPDPAPVRAEIACYNP
jgi:hypothetical protein